MSAYGHDDKVVQHPKTPVIPKPLYFAHEKHRATQCAIWDKIIRGFGDSYDYPKVAGKTLTAYTLICHANGQAVALDARYDPLNGEGKKQHRIIFADQLGLDSIKWGALADHDLLLPGNAPELAQAIWDELRVIVLWCEGEKTRRALQRRLEHPYAIEKAKALGVRLVTSCWFSGFAGAKRTNFALAAGTHQPDCVKVAGANDRALDLNKPVRHIFMRDADADGHKEVAEMMRRFATEYRVDKTKLVICDPPTAVAPESGWDDADPLPAGWTEERRIDEILDAKHEDDVAPPFSEEALALLFAQRRAGDMRYVAARSRWLLWAGARWESDDTLACFDEARAICREMAALCKKNASLAIASAKTVAAVERLAKSDRRIAATLYQWDDDPDIFNTAKEAS